MNPFGFLFDIDGLILLALLLHMNRANDLLFISIYAQNFVQLVSFSCGH